jgi:hypothetical protein
MTHDGHSSKEFDAKESDAEELDAEVKHLKF